MLNPTLIALLNRQIAFDRMQGQFPVTGPVDNLHQDSGNYGPPQEFYERAGGPGVSGGMPVATPYSPMGAPNEHVYDYEMNRHQQDYDQAINDLPQEKPAPNYFALDRPPIPKPTWLDRLASDPQRLGMLRYGLGVIGGEAPGQAMDNAIGTYQGVGAGGPAPQLFNIPVGNNEMVSARWAGPNYQDTTIPGFPKGYQPIGKPRPIWSPWQMGAGGRFQTSQQRNWEQAKKDPAFRDFLKKTRQSMSPKAVQEYEYYKNLDTQGKREYLTVKRNQPAINLGGSQGFADPTDPSKPLIGEIPKTLKPGEELGYLSKAEQSKVGGKGKGERLQEDINVGIRNAEATAIVRRNLDILKTVKTGGWEAAAIKFKAMFGKESANEAELMRNMGIAVLQQIRPIFGAQPTEREGRVLMQLEQGLGKSTVGNVRLLTQALRQLERLADIGLKAAVTSRDYRTAARIKEALEFDLSKGIEAVPGEPSPAEKLKKMTDEEFRRKYDSRRRR